MQGLKRLLLSTSCLLLSCSDHNNLPPTVSVVETTHRVTTPTVKITAPEPRRPSALNMVQISEGQYRIGAIQPRLDGSQSAPQVVEQKAFYLDITEVTNTDFKHFVDYSNAPLPQRWHGALGFSPGEARHPVQGVDWNWANAYCASLGKHLPTEAEWEIASSGSERRDYSWGSSEQAPKASQQSGLYNVGSVAENQTPQGIYDLSANVWEWVGDSYDQLRVRHGQHVLRGGGNGFSRDNVTRDITTDAYSGSYHAGFRCAASEASTMDSPAFETFEPPPASPAQRQGLPGVFLHDDFSYFSGDFLEGSEGTASWGWHPVDRFHVEVVGPNHHALVLANIQPPSDDVLHIRANVSLAKLDKSLNLTFSYGVAFAYDQNGKRGLVFVVDPQNNTWVIAARSDGDEDSGTSEEAYEPIGGTHSFGFRGNEVRLEVIRTVDYYEFHINDQYLSRLRRHDGSVPLDDRAGGTWAGLFVITYAGPSLALAHAHYSLFEVSGE